MTGIQIQVQFNDDQLRRGVALLERTGRALRPALEDIGSALVRSTRQRFVDQEGPDGQAWTKLSAAHLLFKQKKGHSEKVLTMRGRLRSSIVWKVTGSSLAVGTNVKYAAIHQLGGAVHHEERAGQIRLRTDAKGNLLTQRQLRMGPTRMRNADRMLVFAKKSHKRSILQDFVAPAHDVTMPARPFLGLSAADRREILAIVREHLRAALEGNGA